jgi:hypothetical protein
MFFDSKDIDSLIFGAILGPTAGLIGTKVKSMLEERDAQRRAKQMVKQATDLLEFTDTLHKSAAAGGAVAKVPSGSLESLETTVVNKITEAIAAVCPTTRISPRQNPTRTVLDRVLLMHRPLVWWGWAVHGLYYVLMGMLLLITSLAVYDYLHKQADSLDWILPAIFLVPTVIVNVIGNVIGKRHYEDARRAALAENAARP